MRRGWRSLLVAAALLNAGQGAALASTRYAVIVTGASGGPEYAAKYDGWRMNLAETLRTSLGFPADNIFLLGESREDNVRPATREHVRQALAAVARGATKDDVVFVMLIGHGTSMDQDEARFNLVGPDLTASEWAALLKPIAARVVFVNGASGSFPFLETLAAPNRIVITANDSAQQQFETIFPGVFVAAFGPNGADLDRNGRVSVLEAFSYASAGVADHFESRGILATERPLLDDTGDGIGREADAAGRAGLSAPRGAAPAPSNDGKLAEHTYLQSETAIPATTDAELAALLKQRASIEARIDALRTAKPTMPPAQYDEQLEILLLELARIDQAIRQR